jgi:hypothetical protein
VVDAAPAGGVQRPLDERSEIPGLAKIDEAALRRCARLTFSLVRCQHASEDALGSGDVAGGVKLIR